MFKKFIDNKTDIFLLALAAILSLTPIYALGYVLLCIYGARKLHFIDALNTYFANFILSVLVLCSAIMIAGVFTSYLDIPNLAVINLAYALVLMFCIINFQQDKSAKNVKAFDGIDIAAILAAIAIPAAAVAVIVSSIGIDGMLYRVVNGGSWDGVQQFSFWKVDAENNNYMFETSPIEVDGEEISNNYPQGWHVASSDIASGIAPGALNPEEHGIEVTLAIYAATVFSWYALTIYIASKFIVSILPSKRGNILRGALVFVSLQFLAVSILLPAWYEGYVNYIGSLTYVLLAGTYLYQVFRDREGNQAPLFVISSLILIGATGLIWVFPAIILGAICVVALISIGIKKQVYSRSQKVLSALVIFSIVCAGLMYAKLLLTSVDASYIFATPGWVIPLPTTLTTLVCCVVALLLAYRMKVELRPALGVLLPTLFIIGAIWFMSYVLSGAVGYYHVKIFGILFTLVVVFMSAYIIQAAEQVNESKVPILNGALAVGAALSLFAFVSVFSDQNTDIRILHKGSSHTSGIEERKLLDFTYTTDDPKTQLLILREDMLPTGANGSGLFNRRSVAASAEYLTVSELNKRPNTCLIYIFFNNSPEGTQAGDDKSVAYGNLTKCLELRNAKGLKTEIFAPKSQKSDIEKINTYQAKLTYY